MSVVMLKYGIQRSCKTGGQIISVVMALPACRQRERITLTSICLPLKTPLMLELKAAPENMEVTG